MRLVRARTAAGERVGVLGDDGTVALAESPDRIDDHLGDAGDALRAFAAAIVAAPSDVMPLAQLTLTRPVDPPSFRDFMVFEEHVRPSWAKAGLSQGPDVWYEQPIGYLSSVATLRGPGESVAIPGGSRQLDFELEIGAIVGREARSVSPAEATGHIAGFLVLCDWSARDLQARELPGRLGPFKGKDFGSSLGPLFVTPDELADRRSGTGYDLRMTASVNGIEYGSDVWSSAYWSFEELVSYASWNACVEQGALLGSGTCQGGCILELSNRHGSERFPWLRPGDEVRLAVERLGELVVGIDAPQRGGWPGYRHVRR